MLPPLRYLRVNRRCRQRESEGIPKVPWHTRTSWRSAPRIQVRPHKRSGAGLDASQHIMRIAQTRNAVRVRATRDTVNLKKFQMWGGLSSPPERQAGRPAPQINSLKLTALGPPGDRTFHCFRASQTKVRRRLLILPAVQLTLSSYNLFYRTSLE